MRIIQAIILILPSIMLTIDYHYRVKNYPRLSDHDRKLLRNMIELTISNYGDNLPLQIIYKKLGGKIK